MSVVGQMFQFSASTSLFPSSSSLTATPSFGVACRMDGMPYVAWRWISICGRSSIMFQTPALEGNCRMPWERTAGPFGESSAGGTERQKESLARHGILTLLKRRRRAIGSVRPSPPVRGKHAVVEGVTVRNSCKTFARRKYLFRLLWLGRGLARGSWSSSREHARWREYISVCWRAW